MSEISALGAVQRVRLPAGPLEYYDIGEGETLLFFHEFGAGAETWRRVVAELSGRFRCIVPRWPYGPHTVAMPPHADLSPPGIAGLAISLLDALEIEQCALVGSGGGGPMCEIIAAEHPQRVRALAVSTGDALNHFPAPRLWAFAGMAWIPPLSWLFVQACRSDHVLRGVFRLLCNQVPPPEILDSWRQPVLADGGVRRDIRRAARAARPRYSTAAAEALRRFPRPILIVWGRRNLLFPLGDAEELATMWTTSHLVVLDQLRTLIGEDQPTRYAQLLTELMRRASPGFVAAA